jgi:hypothetical protein
LLLARKREKNIEKFAGLQEDLLGEVSGELAGEDRALVDILKRG